LRHPNIRDDHLAAQFTARQQQMSRLFAHKGDGAYCRRGAKILAGVAQDAARNIDGDNRHVPSARGA
jgi:hypothetical protein